MKIVIDWGLCQGHANCTGDAPDVFSVDDNGTSLTVDGTVTAAQATAAASAQAAVDAAAALAAYVPVV